MIVTLCKAAKQPDLSPKSQKSATTSKKYFKLWVPPREERSNFSWHVGSDSNENNGKDDMDQSGATGNSHDCCSTNQNTESVNCADNDESTSGLQDNGNSKTPSSEHQEGTSNPRSGQPSVRPNAMKNRQKQLEALLKYEKKFRQTDKPQRDETQPSTSAMGNVQPGPSLSPRKPAKPISVSSMMVLHVLDISNVLETKTVSWQKLSFDNLHEAPEETIFYSLVEGRGELLMFGGIERDIHSLKWDYGFKAHTVNNSLHVLSPIQQLL